MTQERLLQLLVATLQLGLHNSLQLFGYNSFNVFQSLKLPPSTQFSNPEKRKVTRSSVRETTKPMNHVKFC